jgi:hypothetical protein
MFGRDTANTPEACSRVGLCGSFWKSSHTQHIVQAVTCPSLILFPNMPPCRPTVYTKQVKAQLIPMSSQRSQTQCLSHSQSSTESTVYSKTKTYPNQGPAYFVSHPTRALEDS